MNQLWFESLFCWAFWVLTLFLDGLANFANGFGSLNSQNDGRNNAKDCQDDQNERYGCERQTGKFDSAVCKGNYRLKNGVVLVFVAKLRNVHAENGNWNVHNKHSAQNVEKADGNTHF